MNVYIIIDSNGGMSEEITALKDSFRNINRAFRSGNPLPNIKYNIINFRYSEKLITEEYFNLTGEKVYDILGNISCYGGIREEISLTPLFEKIEPRINDNEKSKNLFFFILGSRIDLYSIALFLNRLKGDNRPVIAAANGEMEREKITSVVNTINGFYEDIIYRYEVYTEYRRINILWHGDFAYLYPDKLEKPDSTKLADAKQIYHSRVFSQESLFNVFEKQESEKIRKIIKKDTNLDDIIIKNGRKIFREWGISFSSDDYGISPVLVKSENNLQWLDIKKKYLTKLKGLTGKKILVGFSIIGIDNEKLIINPDSFFITNKKYISGQVIITFNDIIKEPSYFQKTGILEEKLWFSEVEVKETDE